jgi:hypothetical protein
MGYGLPETDTPYQALKATEKKFFIIALVFSGLF